MTILAIDNRLQIKPSEDRLYRLRNTCIFGMAQDLLINPALGGCPIDVLYMLD
jgi:hypothetical protein